MISFSIRAVRLAVLLAPLLLAPGCQSTAGAAEEAQDSSELATATFAGGCFWCMEPPFDKVDGVVSTISGFTGGSVADPSYEQVSGGRTGHAEAIQIRYNPKKVSYEKLLEVFWQNIDPTDAGGQFCDRGTQYRSGVFYHNDEQRKLAEESKRKIEEEHNIGVVTEITAASTFYPAEGYHQNYYLENPLRYKYYRFSCGRDKRLRELWGN